jgi:hypothetical protein
MNMRLCRECIRDQHISNVVLFHEYGLDLGTIANKYRHFVRFHGVRLYRCPKDLWGITRHPLDLNFLGTRRMVFFWKPDLEKLYDFEELRRAQKERIHCINALKARFKRNFALSQRRRHLVEAMHTNEVIRLTKPMCPAAYLVGTDMNMGRYTGGPFTLIDQMERAQRRNNIINTSTHFINGRLVVRYHSEQNPRDLHAGT